MSETLVKEARKLASVWLALADKNRTSRNISTQVLANQLGAAAEMILILTDEDDVDE
jgi:hypothetical protein